MNWKHFTLEEMTRSRTAELYGFINTPMESELHNLDLLVTRLLDPMREAWGGPIRVTSGYRVPRLNEIVGGVDNSQHTRGQAADIQPMNGDFDGFVKFATRFFKDHEFDQCIIERKGNTRWLHVSYNDGKNRNKMFSMTVK